MQIIIGLGGVENNFILGITTHDEVITGQDTAEREAEILCRGSEGEWHPASSAPSSEPTQVSQLFLQAESRG